MRGQIKGLRLNPHFKMRGQLHIYSLYLKQNKWYIGKSKSIPNRMDQHLNGAGSEWTKKYPPIKIQEVIAGDHFDEDKMVKTYMAKYGIENVRGGSYSQIVLEEDQINLLQKEIRGASDCCFACGSPDHFVRNCPTKRKQKYSKPKKKSVGFLESIYNWFSPPKKKKVQCYKCKKYGHYANKCTN